MCNFAKCAPFACLLSFANSIAENLKVWSNKLNSWHTYISQGISSYCLSLTQKINSLSSFVVAAGNPALVVLKYSLRGVHEFKSNTLTMWSANDISIRYILWSWMTSVRSLQYFLWVKTSILYYWQTKYKYEIVHKIQYNVRWKHSENWKS